MHYNLANNETKFLTIYLSSNDSDFIQDYLTRGGTHSKTLLPSLFFLFQHSVCQGPVHARLVLGTRL